MLLKLTSQLNDLKSQRIADEVKKVDDKISKNSSDIVGFESRLKQKEHTLKDLERTVQSLYGDQYYNNSWLIFKADYHSFDVSNSKYINYWRSKGIFNGTLDGVAYSLGKKPDIHLAGEIASVNFNGNYFKQLKIDCNRSVMAIHIVYKLSNKIISSTDYVQVNEIFRNCKLTKTTDNLHYGYSDGICVVFFYSTGEYNGLILEKLIEIC